VTARISLTGKVAVVTGAGRGLGRAYALALAERGARVVVNDLGTDPDGHGRDASPAEQVAAAIRAAGGQAIADVADVSDPAAGAAIVERAMAEYGRIDVLVNNAGICGNQPFADTTLADFEQYWRIHVGGHINTTHAAWPAMIAQGGGRIVFTESAAGLYGLPGQATYAAAKGAIHGLMRTLALEGAEHGILVNSVAPGGFSRMHEAAIDDPVMREATRNAMPTELVAPLIVWLAGDTCTATGEVFTAWGGRVARTVIGAGRGLVDRALAAETIVERYAEVSSADELYEPRFALDEVSTWTARMNTASTCTE
jgi:NAD(P)-dependent dehydrogenase (short-subunit alcohol dehydrogenase family)